MPSFISGSGRRILTVPAWLSSVNVFDLAKFRLLEFALESDEPETFTLFKTLEPRLVLASVYIFLRLLSLGIFRRASRMCLSNVPNMLPALGDARIIGISSFLFTCGSRRRSTAPHTRRFNGQISETTITLPESALGLTSSCILCMLSECIPSSR